MRFRIDLKILIFFVVFYFTNQLNLYIWIMIFGFIHELGHLVMGMALGLKPDKLEIMPFGFFLEFKTNVEKSNKRRFISDILISIAGPATNLLIIIIILLLHISFIGRDIAVYINLMLFAFNLLPIYPLDGGKILKIIFEIKYGIIKSDIFINRISNWCIITLTMLGSIAIYYFKNISIMLIILYLWTIIIKENKRFNIRTGLLNYNKN